MSADHNTLDALRRLAKDRAATPAEKATARRLAIALAAKIGTRPRRGRRKGHSTALPEPPAARRRRLWIVSLEGALNKIEVVGWWLHGIWIVSIIVLGPLLVFGNDAVRQQVIDVYVVRTLGLVAVALVMVAIAGFLTCVAWWLRTMPGERLRAALAWSAKTLPPITIMGAAITAGAMIEIRATGRSMLVQCATMVVGMLLIWAYWRIAPLRAAASQ
jgi:hypothetical protein